MKTLVKKACCPPLSVTTMEKINFMHRNSETQVLLPVCYYKYNAASPYSWSRFNAPKSKTSSEDEISEGKLSPWKGKEPIMLK